MESFFRASIRQACAALAPVYPHPDELGRQRDQRGGGYDERAKSPSAIHRPRTEGERRGYDRQHRAACGEVDYRPQ